MRGMIWITASVLVGLMAAGAIDFAGPWKWAAFALVLAIFGVQGEHRKGWFIRWW
jgi:hypothetical protein